MNVKRVRSATAGGTPVIVDEQYEEVPVIAEEPSDEELEGDPDRVSVIADESDQAAEVLPYEPSDEPPDVPQKHSPLWHDMVRVMLVFAGGYVAMQVVVSAIMTMFIVLLDPQIQTYLTDHTNTGEGLTAVMNDPGTTQFLLQRVNSYSLPMTIVGDLAAIALYFIIRKRQLVTTDLTTTRPVNNRWLELGVALVFIFGIQMVLSLVDKLISLTGYDPSSVQSNLLGSDTGSVVGVIGIVIVIPFLEEWIFRGAILRHLVPYGVNFAIVTQAVLFGLWHSNLYQGIFAFLIGLILGYVAYHFSLKWSYALHAVSNGAAFMMNLTWMPEWVGWTIFALGLAGSVAIIVYFRQVIPVLVSEGASAIEHPFHQGWRNPAFIAVGSVMLVICCVMMVAAGG